MSESGAVARMLVLSEDRSRDAVPTVKALFAGMLKHLDPEANLTRIEFDPLPDSRASTVVHGNVWKSAKGVATAGVVDLVQRIATYLMAEHFVVHHVDGDTVWAERATSENARRYQDVIVRGVREALRRAKREPRKLTEAEVELRLQRLLVLMPHWCVESWLFQNTTEARRHCPGGDHPCPARLDAWEDNRELLDEERSTKELLCFRDRHNLTLAQSGLPTQALLDAGQSYSATVEMLRSRQPLREALARTG